MQYFPGSKNAKSSFGLVWGGCNYGQNYPSFKGSKYPVGNCRKEKRLAKRVANCNLTGLPKISFALPQQGDNK